MKSWREADFAAFSRVFSRVVAWVWSKIGNGADEEVEGKGDFVGDVRGGDGTPRRMLDRRVPVKREGSWDTRERWERYSFRGIVGRERFWKRIWPFWGV